MKTKQPIISVIVPVYNVEEYLEKCLTSIVNQTYKKIEIILIDDGSTDKSGIICDRWAQRDNRIQVFHKKNGGLSSARNFGLEKATGEYLMFIDSDDWIDEIMVEELFKNTDKGDLICSGIIEATNTECKYLPWFKKELILKPVDALTLLVDNTMLKSHITPKLYKKYLFNSIKFPEGKVFEDIRIQHKLFMECRNNIVIVPKHYYYYFSRENSITRETNFNFTKQWIEALENRYIDVTKINKKYADIIISQIAIIISLSLVQNSYSKKELILYRNTIKNMQSFLKQRSVSKIVKNNATKSQFAYYLIARMFSYRFNKWYRIMKGEHR